ncbi:MAG: protein kinase [Planctomycetes bacterium]|nr:protein kinase [Planctomycetota bacterium]
MDSATDPDRFRRVQELFDRALDVPAAERAAFLQRECGDDDALLADVTSLLDADAAPTWTASEATSELAMAWSLPAGARVGSFTIVRSIGEGGMGTVYEATQERPQRVVALKTLRAGSDSPKARRRFEYESELLGRLQHPGIAQIYEAGTFHDGRREVPFLAMEMLSGARAIDDHIEERDAELRYVLSLFADVCEAVQHAHQHGVVHRDLKPSNLLVDADGRVKVIDFGIATAVDTEEARRTLRTETGVILGTVAYMSPEQLDPDAGSPDARTDVYSLGVLMFQLLTGRLPHDLDTLPVPTALAVIAERDVPQLALYGLRGGAPVPRELDWILQKATERDVAMRYQTVAELGADVRRFLDDRPLEVGPPSTAYRLRKFVRRHRAAVGGAALALIALIAGTVATAIGWRRAVLAEQVAESKRGELEQVTFGFWQTTQMTENMEQIKSTGISDEMRAQLDAVATRLDGQSIEDRAVEAALRVKLAKTYAEFDAREQATAQFRRALELTDDGGGMAEVRIEALTAYGTTLLTEGDAERGIELLEQAVALAERHPSAFAEPPALPRSRIAYGLHLLGRYEEARDTYDAALRELAARPDAAARPTLKFQALVGRGNAHRALGNREAGLADIQAALTYAEQRLGLRHDRTLGARMDLAILLLQDKEMAPRAEELLREVTEARVETLGPTHTQTITPVLNLAFALHRQGKFDESEELCTRHLQAAREAGVADSIPLLKLRFNLGVAQMMREPARLEAAERTFRDLLADGAPGLGDDHWMMLAFRARLGMCRAQAAALATDDPDVRARCLAEARAELEPALAGLEQTLGPANRQTREAANALHQVLESQGEAEAAATLAARLQLK